MKTTKRILWSRQCDITGEGMNEGYCIQDGLMYIKHDKDMINHIREVERKHNPEYDILVSKGEITDDSLLNDYCEADYYYWTEWELDDIQWEEVDGKLIDFEL